MPLILQWGGIEHYVVNQGDWVCVVSSSSSFASNHSALSRGNLSSSPVAHSTYVSWDGVPMPVFTQAGSGKPSLSSSGSIASQSPSPSRSTGVSAAESLSPEPPALAQATSWASSHPSPSSSLSVLSPIPSPSTRLLTGCSGTRHPVVDPSLSSSPSVRSHSPSPSLSAGTPWCPLGQSGRMPHRRRSSRRHRRHRPLRHQPVSIRVSGLGLVHRERVQLAGTPSPSSVSTASQM